MDDDVTPTTTATYGVRVGDVTLLPDGTVRKEKFVSVVDTVVTATGEVVLADRNCLGRTDAVTVRRTSPNQVTIELDGDPKLYTLQHEGAVAACSIDPVGGHVLLQTAGQLYAFNAATRRGGAVMTIAPAVRFLASTVHDDVVYALANDELLYRFNVATPTKMTVRRLNRYNSTFMYRFFADTLYGVGMTGHAVYPMTQAKPAS